MDTVHSDELTFIQMNFWMGRLHYPIESFLQREKPDIFSAQEMLSGPVDISPSFLTAETLIQKGYFDTVSSGKSMPWLRYHEQDFVIQSSTFTKGNIQHTTNNSLVLFIDPSKHPVEELNMASYACLLHTQLKLQDGIEVHVLNHHGRLVKGENGRFQSEVADYNFSKIAEYASQLSGPIILSGDFNLVKEASSLNPLKEIGLMNLNDVHNITVARNEFSWRANEAVSHIFISPDIDVKEYRIPTDNVSDHLPLVMKFRINRP